MYIQKIYTFLFQHVVVLCSAWPLLIVRFLFSFDFLSLVVGLLKLLLLPEKKSWKMRLCIHVASKRDKEVTRQLDIDIQWVFKFINLYPSRHYLRLSTLPLPHSSSFNFSRLLLTAYTRKKFRSCWNIAWRSLTGSLITSQSLTSASQSLWNHNNQSFAPDIEQELARLPFVWEIFFYLWLDSFFFIHERENSIDVESDQKIIGARNSMAYNRRSDNFFLPFYINYIQRVVEERQHT